jgi:hypothetical protein
MRSLVTNGLMRSFILRRLYMFVWSSQHFVIRQQL